MWLFFLPSFLDLLFPVWGFHDFENSGIAPGPYNTDVEYVALVASLTVVVYVNFFWVYATLPSNMRQKDGTGSAEFVYYISVVGMIYLKLIRPCFVRSNQTTDTDEDASEPLYQTKPEFGDNSTTALLKSDDDSTWPQSFLWRVFGSDYTVGVLIFTLSSTVGLVISGIMAYDNSTDTEYIYGVVCSLVFTVGTYVLLHASHPLRMSENDGRGSRDCHLALRRLCGATSQVLSLA